MSQKLGCGSATSVGGRGAQPSIRHAAKIIIGKAVQFTTALLYTFQHCNPGLIHKHLTFELALLYCKVDDCLSLLSDRHKGEQTRNGKCQYWQQTHSDGHETDQCRPLAHCLIRSRAIQTNASNASPTSATTRSCALPSS